MQFHLPSFLRRVRIHGGEFDSSARAMNREKQVRLLQADLRIVRGSTIERKQMSTKTTLKRISLVAVAALGLSLVAVAPSSAVPQVDTLTASALTATAAPGAAASVTLTHTYLSTGTSDTVTATVSIQSMPAGNTALPVLASVTTNDTGSPTKVISGLTASTGSVAASTAVRGDYTLSLTTLTTGTYVFVVTPQSGSKASALTLTYTIADTAAAPTATASRVYMRTGTANGVGTAPSLLLDGNGYSQTAKINETGTVTYSQATLMTNLAAHIAAADTNTSNVTTLSVSGGISTLGTTVATFGVILANGASLSASTISGAVQESYAPNYAPKAGYYFNAPGHPVTVTVTGPGSIAYGGVTKGKTYTEVTADGPVNYLQKTYSLVSDGTNGASTITFTAGGVTLATRTVNFVGTAASYAFGTPTKTVTGVGETSSVSVTGADSLGTTTGAASVYAFSSDTSVATVNTTQASTVVVTGVKSGTATITVGNASTIATSTITKTLAVKVGGVTATTVSIAMSNTTPTAGEQVTVTLTALDASGNAIGDGARLLLAAGGFSPSVTLPGTSTVPTAETVTTVNGVATYTFYAPTAGIVTFTATEGAATASTTKAKITGSVTVSNPGLDAATDAAIEAFDAANAATDAALSAAEAADLATQAAQEASDAVAALSETVTQLIAGLQAQIKSLAAVVAKIAAATAKIQAQTKK